MSSTVNADLKLATLLGRKGEKKDLEDTSLNIVHGQNMILDNHRNTLKTVRKRNRGDDWNWLTNLSQTLPFVTSGNLFMSNIFS